MAFSTLSLTVAVLLTAAQHFYLVLGAIGDSRLRISISYPINLDQNAPKPSALVRLYDPATDLTYHQANETQIVQALASLWNPLFHPDKCGAVYDPRRKISLRMCDPEKVIPSVQALDIQQTAYNIPRVTGCQCDSFQHCNHYESGFNMYIAVVPTIMRAITTPYTIIANSSASSPRNTAQATLGPPGTALKTLLGTDKNTLPVIKVQPTNLVIPREMSGKLTSVIDKNADIYDILASYLRALWSTGECDEDMVVCFFPKERKVSLSAGQRVLDKLTTPCISSLLAETAQRLAEPAVALTPQEAIEQNKALASIEDEYDGSMSRAASIAKRQQKERLRMTTLFKSFVDNVNKLIQSRSDNPCASYVVTKWSDYEILGFAVLSGVGISIVLAATLKLCAICSDFLDQLIEDTPQSSLGRAWRRRGAKLRIPFNNRLACSDDAFDCKQESPIRVGNVRKQQKPINNINQARPTTLGKTAMATLKCEIGETVIVERTMPSTPNTKRPTAV